MTLEIALIGLGRFGRTIASLILQNPAYRLASAIVRTNPGKDLGSLLNLPPTGILLTSSRTCPCDVYIDVSLPEALSDNLEAALAAQKPIVIGTTGLSPSQLDSIQHASQTIPIFQSPNFSLGMALLRKLAALTSSHFHPDAHIDLIETHHVQKKDAPSGSALLLAKEIEKPVSIHSLRTGKIIGEHTLIFNTAEERITLSHEAHSRDAFARGALAAAQFISSQPPGLYNMNHLF